MPTDPAPPPVLDVGLTDPLDGLLGDRLLAVRTFVDANAGLRVDEHGVALRRVLRHSTVRWRDVGRVVLDSRLDVGLAYATRFLPVRRVPVVGGLLVDVAQDAAGTLARRFVPGLRQRAGWVVATLERPSRVRRDVEVDGAPGLAALLRPEAAEAIAAHATARGIDVLRR